MIAALPDPDQTDSEPAGVLLARLTSAGGLAEPLSRPIAADIAALLALPDGRFVLRGEPPRSDETYSQRLPAEQTPGVPGRLALLDARGALDTQSTRDGYAALPPYDRPFLDAAGRLYVHEEMPNDSFSDNRDTRHRVTRILPRRNARPERRDHRRARHLRAAEARPVRGRLDPDLPRLARAAGLPRVRAAAQGWGHPRPPHRADPERRDPQRRREADRFAAAAARSPRQAARLGARERPLRGPYGRASHVPSRARPPRAALRASRLRVKAAVRGSCTCASTVATCKSASDAPSFSNKAVFQRHPSVWIREPSRGHRRRSCARESGASASSP